MERGHASDADIVVARRLLGHLCRAHEIERALGGARVRQGIRAAVVDEFAIGVIALDEGGCVLLANREALRLANVGAFEIGERVSAIGTADSSGRGPIA